MSASAPWDDIDLATALATSRELGIDLPVDAAIAIALGVLQDVEAADRLEDGAWRREVHGRIQPSLVRISAAGAVSLEIPGPLSGDLPDEFRFVAPEVAAGTPPTHRSDMFAVGALLFEMSTGHPIVPGPGPLEVARQIQSLEPVVLLHPHRPALGELTDLLLRALAPDPRQRFATADQFAEELKVLARRRGAESGSTVQFLETVFRSRPSIEIDREPSLPGVAAAFDALEHSPESSDEVVLEDGGRGAPRAPWELQDDPIIAALDLVPHGGPDELDEPSTPPLWSNEAGDRSADAIQESRPPVEPSPWEPDARPSSSGAVSVRSGDEEDDEAATSQVRGGAFLFADGRCVGPLPLLDMDRELARVRDPAALVAFEAGHWRPVAECAFVRRRSSKGERRSFDLLSLGPLLLEIGAGSRLHRVSLWSGPSAVVIELGQSRVWRAGATDVAPMLRRMVRDEGLLSTDSLPDDADVANDEVMLRWLEGRRLLNAGQVVRLRRQILRRAAAAPFDWEIGEALVLDVGPCPTLAPDTIELTEVIAFAVRDVGTPSVIEGALYREREKDVVLSEDARSRCAELPLNPAELRFVSELPSRVSLTEALVGEWHDGRESAFALLFLCISLGLVRLE